MSSDNVNGKITEIEMQIALDEMRRTINFQIEVMKNDAKLCKARYDALKSEGFSDTEALEIVKARGGTNL